MNIAPSLAEAYNYAEMFNSKYDGGADLLEKINTAGLPVQQLITSNGNIQGGGQDSLADKAIPAGLVLDCRRNKRQIEYEPHLESRHSGVISDELFDRLFDAVTPSKRRRNVTSKHASISKSYTKKNYKK